MVRAAGLSVHAAINDHAVSTIKIIPSIDRDLDGELCARCCFDELCRSIGIAGCALIRIVVLGQKFAGRLDADLDFLEDWHYVVARIVVIGVVKSGVVLRVDECVRRARFGVDVSGERSPERMNPEIDLHLKAAPNPTVNQRAMTEQQPTKGKGTFTAAPRSRTVSDSMPSCEFNTTIR